MGEKTERQNPVYLRKMLTGIAYPVIKNQPRSLHSWDHVQPCTSDCPAYVRPDVCPMTRNSNNCPVMKEYLEAVVDLLHTKVPNIELVGEDALWRLGMHIMPLYRMLCKMKIAEACVSGILYSDDKGRLKANPIYKEMRETIKQVESMMKEIGFGGKLLVGDPFYSDMETDMETDDYYSRMASDTGIRRRS